jgi:hypothetical protein
MSSICSWAWKPIREPNCDFHHILTGVIRDPILLSGTSMPSTSMPSADTRDAETILSQVGPEFRRACEAQREFFDWYGSRLEASFSESLHRFSEMIEAGEQWAASYRRVSAEFPTHTDRLHTLLRPIQHEVFGSGAPPSRHQHNRLRSLKRLGRHRNDSDAA